MPGIAGGIRALIAQSSTGFFPPFFFFSFSLPPPSAGHGPAAPRHLRRPSDPGGAGHAAHAAAADADADASLFARCRGGRVLRLGLCQLGLGRPRVRRRSRPPVRLAARRDDADLRLPLESSRGLPLPGRLLGPLNSALFANGTSPAGCRVTLQANYTSGPHAVLWDGLHSNRFVAVTVVGATLDLFLDGIQFANGSATGGDALHGGVILVSSSVGSTSSSQIQILVRNCRFESSSAALGAGGSIAFHSTGSLLVHFSTFSNCSAGSAGGALSISGTGMEFVVTNSIFLQCAAGQQGGAVFFQRPRPLFSPSTPLFSPPMRCSVRPRRQSLRFCRAALWFW